MALGAKLKLGFIDGSCAIPPVGSEELQRWIRCDYMVTCWILNSMVTEFSDAFLYSQSACELWREIRERYGQSNGPLVYQLERELSKITQGNLSIASYFNKLKKCWDELQNLNVMPTCNCGKMRECTCSVLEKFALRDSNTKLIQFLMKLSDEYESVRICVDNKAFSNSVAKHLVDLKTFHERLGHTSISKLVHIPESDDAPNPVTLTQNALIPNTPSTPVENTPNPTPPIPPDLNAPKLNASSNTNVNPPPPTRRSTRQSTRPAWLKDFVAPPGPKSTPHYPLFASTEFAGLPQSHIAFLANVFVVPEPTRFFCGFKEDQKASCGLVGKNTIAIRELGGIGVGSFHAKNLDLLAKWQ
ncbi:hypothetical protein CTI12_AA255210 [Artemisia annua]|uniref:Uncharacterized protein n=1 Tax=Artemisia annua TaxID=35608 RepID=A0A2U1NL46_ARTAN|nr:hypothetical protein CTI12_AA255210 [Artemisia annua]